MDQQHVLHRVLLCLDGRVSDEWAAEISTHGEADEPSTLEFELVGRTKGLRLARVGDVVLAERNLARAAGTQTTTLKLPKAFRRSLSRRFSLTIRVTATDAAGNRTVKTSTLKVR